MSRLSQRNLYIIHQNPLLPTLPDNLIASLQAAEEVFVRTGKTGNGNDPENRLIAKAVEILLVELKYHDVAVLIKPTQGDSDLHCDLKLLARRFLRDLDYEVFRPLVSLLISNVSEDRIWNTILQLVDIYVAIPRAQDSERSTAWNDNQTSTAVLHNPHSYDRLPSGSIRLLSVFSGEKHELLRCKLEQFELSRQLNFVALSYVWGDPSDQVPISLNESHFSIGRNLYHALHQIRDWQDSCALQEYLDADECIWIWADAICINQNDVLEKSEQIQQMDKIFSSASLVVCWLGISGSENDDDMRLLMETARNVSGSNQDTDQKDDPAALADRWNSIVRRDWFERIWMIQEYALAQVSVFAVGQWFCQSEALLDFGLAIPNRDLNPNDIVWRSLVLFRGEYRVKMDKVRLHGEYQSLIMEQRRLRQRQQSLEMEMQDHEGLNTMNSTSIPISEVDEVMAVDDHGAKSFAEDMLNFLIISSMHRSSMIHDRIYAGLGLLISHDYLKHTSVLVPDYRKPFGLVCQEYAAYIMGHAKDIYLLSLGPYRGSKEPSIGGVVVPSWVPNIGLAIPAVPHSRSEDTGLGSEGSEVHVVVKGNGKELEVEGVILGEVTVSFDLNVASRTLGHLSWAKIAPLFEETILRPSSERLGKGLREIIDEWLRFVGHETSHIGGLPDQSESLEASSMSLCILSDIVRRLEDPRWFEVSVSDALLDNIRLCDYFLADDGTILSSLHRSARHLRSGDKIVALRGLECPILLRQKDKKFEYLGCCVIASDVSAKVLDGNYFANQDLQNFTII